MSTSLRRDQKPAPAPAEQVTWEGCGRGGQLVPLVPLVPSFLHLSCSDPRFHALGEEFAFGLKLAQWEKPAGFTVPAFQWDKNEAQGELPRSRVVVVAQPLLVLELFAVQPRRPVNGPANRRARGLQEPANPAVVTGGVRRSAPDVERSSSFGAGASPPTPAAVTHGAQGCLGSLLVTKGE